MVLFFLHFPLIDYKLFAIIIKHNKVGIVVKAKVILILISILTLVFNINTVKAENFNLSSDAAIIRSENQILYAKNETKKTQIASLTKIMTAIVVLENTDDLNKKVVIKKSDLDNLLLNDLAYAGFFANESVTIRDLLYGLMLPSGADAAYTLARVTGGSEASFVDMMNEKADELGLTSTHFSNPVGLDDAKNYSTAEEVSKMFNYALSIKAFKKIVTTDSYQTSNLNHTFTNHIRKNAIVGDYLEGGKTGTTDKAGLCLASFAYDKGEKLISVTLNAPLDYISKPQYTDTKTLLSYYIENYDTQKIVSKGDKAISLSTKYALSDFVNFYITKNKYLYLPNGFNPNKLKYEYSGIEELTTDMKKGIKLGKLNVTYNDKIVYTQEIRLGQKLSFNYKKYIKEHLMFVLTFIFVVFIIFLSLITKKRFKKA